MGPFGEDRPGRTWLLLVAVGAGVVLGLPLITDNRPDLFVYRVPETAEPDNVDRFVDLGALNGNVGDQQYDIPSDVAVNAVCRVSLSGGSLWWVTFYPAN